MVGIKDFRKSPNPAIIQFDLGINLLTKNIFETSSIFINIFLL